MKRRYKPGDWFAVTLDARSDAVGVITHACRSRLFGYFFAVAAGERPAHAQLKGLRAQDAGARMLFGGAALEDLRWPIIATSVPYDPQQWPFPAFAERGAFGRTWARCRFDEATLQPLEKVGVSAAQVDGLPAAHFANATEVEVLLRERFCAAPPSEPAVICEVCSPLDIASLDVLESGGRVQFAQPLDSGDLEALGAALNANPRIELRIHGADGFDLRTLAGFDRLRALVLDCPPPTHLQALGELGQLQRLRLRLWPGADLRVLAKVPQLRALELYGCGANPAALAGCRSLEELTLIATDRVDLGTLADLPLTRLRLEYGAYDLSNIARLRALERLELCTMQLAALPDLGGNSSLCSIVLRAVRLLRDLGPLQTAPALREVHVQQMLQLRAADLEPLKALNLDRVTIDLGNRTLTREAYRALGMGRMRHEI